jgi:L-iditol 2-dehydrogenase
MLACLLKGSEKVILEDVPIPVIGAGEVLVQMKACGICGTDLEKIKGELDSHGILGHEPSGIIKSVGKNVSNFKPGDRVVVHHHVPCYTCINCTMGDYTLCSSFKSSNIDPCGFAEYFRVPEFNTIRGAIVRVPTNLGFDVASLIEPTACCIRAINKANVRPFDNVLIIGLGPTGLTQVQLLRPLTEGKIAGIDFLEARREAASKYGTDHELDPSDENLEASLKQLLKQTDLVIVSTGNPAALALGLRLVDKGGRLLLFGAPGTHSLIELNYGGLFAKQVQFTTSYSCVESEIRTAINLVSQGSLDLQHLITDKFTLNEAVEAFHHARSSRSTIKTIITN